MGLFSKKKLYTSSQIMHMVEDTPEILKQSVLNSIIVGSDIVPDILDTVGSCLASKASNYHTYAAKSYTNKLPEGTIGYESISTSKITKALDLDRPPKEGYKNLALGVYISNFSTEKASHDYLNKTYPSWDSITESFEGKVGQHQRVMQCFYSSSKVVNSSTVALTYYYKVASNGGNNSGGTTVTNVYVTVNFTVAEYSIEPTEEYYIAEYVEVDLLDETKVSEPYYWQYQISSGIHPELDVSIQEYSYFMPVVPIRVNNVDYTSDDRKDTDLYKTSIKLLHKVDIDFLQLGEGINASPDIAEVDHAYFLMGVNPKSEKDGVAEYLYQFFSDMELQSVNSKNDYDTWLKTISNKKNKNNTRTNYSNTTPPLNYIDIKDETYSTTLSWYYVDRRLISGSVGKIGSVTKEVIGNYSDIGITVGKPSSDKPNASGFTISMENHRNCIILRKQISKSHYQELTVSGLLFYNNIYATSSSCVSSLNSEEGNEIIIPLNVDIIRGMNKIKANTLMYDALIVVINSYKWVKLKWYQTGFFKIVMVVIAIAVTIISWGGLSGISAALVSLAAAGTAAIIIAIVKFVLIQIIIAVAFKFAAEHLGIEVAFILAIIAMCYGFSSGEIGMPDLPFADAVLNAGLIGASAIQEFAADSIENIMNELNSFVETAEETLEDIKELQKELNPLFQLDPLGLYTEVGMLPKESSSEYIHRTLSFPTMNTLGLQSITTYVDNKLNLDNY